MELTQFQTFFPPDVTVIGTIPFSIARAAHGRPARVVIDNVGATMVFLAGTEQDLTGGGATSGSFRLLPGANRTFVLAPEQVLYAAGSGAGAIISVTNSDAIPLGWEMDREGNYRPANEGLPRSRNPAYNG